MTQRTHLLSRVQDELISHEPSVSGSSVFVALMCSCYLVFFFFLGRCVCRVHDKRFDAEQRGLMTDSGAVEDSLLEGFDNPWPRPRYAAAATAAGPVKNDGGAAGVVGEAGRRSPSEGSSSPAAAAAAEAAAKQRLVLPEGVLLKHAVQVWNALCVFPRPMGLRPPPTLDQLMRAIVMVSPRWRPGGAGGSGEGSKTEEKEGGEEDGEAEFDEKKASIRAASAGGKQGRKGGVEEEGGEEAKKEAQALLDGVCMSIVRVLSIDLHTVLGR